jgi:hypothetical protein
MTKVHLVTRVALIVVVTGALSVGCVGRVRPVGYEIVYVEQPPPVERIEVVETRPGVEFAWIPGYWRWERREYLWSQGHWERVPRMGAAWVPGRWQHGRRGWYFVPGHWR